LSLRLPHDPRVLWIDAICINQSDSKKKTEQVQMMNLIYSRSREVTIWLGEEDSHSKMFVRYCDISRLIHNGEQPGNDSMSKCIDKFASDKELRGYSRSLAIQDGITSRLFYWPTSNVVLRRIMESFIALMSRPWFRRIWVYQEIFLAPLNVNGQPQANIVIGATSLLWTDFIHAAAGIFSTPFTSKESSPHYAKLANHDFHSWFSLAWLYPSTIRYQRMFADEFRKTSRFLASDPRDKLFVLLHLGYDTQLQLSLSPYLRPNYEKTLQSIILDFSRASIHLPLAIRTSIGVDQPYFDHPPYSNHDEHVFELTFWHTHEDPTVPRSNHLLILDDVYPRVSPTLQGNIVSSVVETCDCSFIWKQRPANSAEDYAIRTIRQLTTYFKKHTAEESDFILLKNILRMLDVEESNIMEWRSFAENYLYDILDCSFPEHLSHDDSQGGTSLSMVRFGNHGGTIWSYEEFRKQVPEDEQARYHSSWTYASLFLDSRGRIILSHTLTQPGDLVVTIEGTTSSFIMSPVEKHVFNPDIYRLQQDHIARLQSKSQGVPRQHQSHLFFWCMLDLLWNNEACTDIHGLVHRYRSHCRQFRFGGVLRMIT
jgi:hypothetical protein